MSHAISASSTSSSSSNNAGSMFDSLSTRSKHEAITAAEFNGLLSSIFTDTDTEQQTTIGKSSSECCMRQQIFDTFDANHDGLLNRREFTLLWNSNWLNTVRNPSAALIIVDVQNDFIDGSLALKNCPAGQDGAKVVPVINRILKELAEKFKLVVYTQDWHPSDHCSFAENVHLRKLSSRSKISRAVDAKPFDTVTFLMPGGAIAGGWDMEQKLWPTHCVQSTWGAELHADLHVLSATNVITVQKGVDADMDCYSGFGNLQYQYHTKLLDQLKSHPITDVFVCGLAYDVCVFHTLMDSLKLGFRTVLVEDAAQGVSHESMQQCRQKFVDNNGYVTTSDMVGDLLRANVRPLVMGVQGLKQHQSPPTNTATNGRLN